MVSFTTVFTGAVALLGAVQPAVGGHVVVTGSTTGGVASRHEIRELQANHHVQWNIFLLAMEAMQHEKQSSKLSYYAIAGIHGVPYQSWDGVGQTGNGGGYCPHSSNMFGPWHRPYLALIEQRLGYHARNIAKKFPAGKRRKAAMKAAKTLRLPYWDWAKNAASAVPASVKAPKIRVTRANGKSSKINNPLFAYHFHPLNSGALIFGPENQWHATKRAPTSDQPNAKSNNAAVENTFRNMRPSLRQAVYALMAQGGKYNKISNWGKGSASNNFEAIHNNIHAGCGTNSHMSVTPLSSFDPIFWLHHANVDRLLAIWQKLHPQTYVVPTSQSASAGTWTIRKNSKQGATSPLKPFRRTKGAFWTSKSARAHKVFKYTYPELRGSPSIAAVRAKVNRLYGGASGVSANVANKLRRRDLSEFLKTVTDVDITLDITPGETLYEYSTDIAMPRALTDQPYSIMVFLGPITSEPASYLEDANLVGYQASLGNLMGADPNLIRHSSVYLTQAILAKFAAGELSALDKDTVSDYLADNLHWRAVENGALVNKKEIPGVTVKLVSQALEAPTSDEDFPNYFNLDHIIQINATLPI